MSNINAFNVTKIAISTDCNQSVSVNNFTKTCLSENTGLPWIMVLLLLYPLQGRCP